MLQEHVLALNALSDRWRNLEERIKAAEQITGTVIIPSINELRYAGRRFMDAWILSIASGEAPGSKEEFATHIAMAVQYYYNADHDLIDAIIVFFSAREEQLLLKYGLLRSLEMYPKFMAWVDRLHKAQEIIRFSRKSRETRIASYKTLELDFIPELCSEYKSLVVSESLYAAKRRFERFLNIILTIFGIVGSAAGCAAAFADWEKLITSWHHLLKSVGL